MADHVRKQVRDAVKTALTGLTTTGARVFDFPVRPLEVSTQTPGLAVYFGADSAEPSTIHGPPVVQRTAELLVMGAAAANSQLDNTLDLIAKEVEAALTSLTVGGKSVEFIYIGCDFDRETEPGEKEYGTITLHFRCELFNLAGAPDALI